MKIQNLEYVFNLHNITFNIYIIRTFKKYSMRDSTSLS